MGPRDASWAAELSALIFRVVDTALAVRVVRESPALLASAARSITSCDIEKVLEIPLLRFGQVPRAVEDEEHRHVLVVHRREALQELGRDEEVLRPRSPHAVLHDALEHQPLVPLVHALVDLVHHSKRGLHHVLQRHEEHDGRHRPLPARLDGLLEEHGSLPLAVADQQVQAPLVKLVALLVHLAQTRVLQLPHVARKQHVELLRGGADRRRPLVLESLKRRARAPVAPLNGAYLGLEFRHFRFSPVVLHNHLRVVMDVGRRLRRRVAVGHHGRAVDGQALHLGPQGGVDFLPRVGVGGEDGGPIFRGLADLLQLVFVLLELALEGHHQVRFALQALLLLLESALLRRERVLGELQAQLAQTQLRFQVQQQYKGLLRCLQALQPLVHAHAHLFHQHFSLLVHIQLLRFHLRRLELVLVACNVRRQALPNAQVFPPLLVVRGQLFLLQFHAVAGAFQLVVLVFPRSEQRLLVSHHRFPREALPRVLSLLQKTLPVHLLDADAHLPVLVS
mmetsp:Transcript_60712/g.114258  ORF Transcript_60712/g.114258 Transcript_60712/m.114258 type:complete len:508 (-) Transcript_60712:1826-3349(-)